MPSAKEQSMRTICGFCHANCGLVVTLKQGVIHSIKPDPEHPINMGVACTKGLAGKSVVYAEDRLKFPLRKADSGFKRITWDEALDTIAEKLLQIKNRYGGEAIVRAVGAPVTEENRDAFALLIASLGSNNTVGTGHICHMPRSLGFRSVFGQMAQPDYKNTKLIVIWGANPLASRQFGEAGISSEAAYGRFSAIYPQARKRGVKFIVIDPWKNKLAEKADIWLQIEPGRNDALALAMLNIIILEDLYDHAFVANWTSGFDRLAAYIEPYTPEWAEKVTRIKASLIRQVARIYAETKPALIREGNALDQYPNAVHSTRAIAMLEAITGNLDIEGGNVFLPYPRLSLLTPATDIKMLGDEEYPLLRVIPFPFLSDAILSGKPYQPRAMLIHHTNPLLVQADSSRTREALQKLEFMVVYDIFKTATAEMADIILPAASPFERYGYRGYASAKGGFVALRRKVVEPIGECRAALDIEYELASRMGLSSAYDWHNSEEWITHRLQASNVTFEQLREKQIIYTTPPKQYKKYLQEGFKTPSKKVELFSPRYEAMGYAPLPEYRDIDNKYLSRLDVQNIYPLIGTTYRSPYFTHSQFRNIKEMRRLEPEPFVRINAIDAKKHGIKSGDWAILESERGSIKIKAKITEETMPGVVIVDFGWGNPWDGAANVNLLTSDVERDPISCSTSNRRFRCQIRKA